MGKYFRLFVVLFVLFSIITLSAQRRKRGGEVVPGMEMALPQLSDSIRQAMIDSLKALPMPDSLLLDSLLRMDSIPKSDSIVKEAKKKESALNEPVKYKAQDSMTFSNGNWATMYGQSTVNYKDIQLDADFIAMNLDSNNVYARGGEKLDSITKKPVGQPKFKDKGGEYTSETMKYNFASQKGYITNVVTQQGEGYVTGGKTKKLANNDLYMMGGKYTTCDQHDHPHFYFGLTRAKVSPGKNIVTGPAYLVMEDVTLPLAVPFGFFPFSSSYQSGIIFPGFGQELNRGFFLRNGGYYFALSDYIDLALTGEIYTKGSWGLNARSAYVKKYKFNGSFNLGYLITVTGDKGMPDYQKSTDFKLMWTHTQDAKANPNSTFSASVNLSSSTYDRKQMDSYYNPNQFTQNTKSSSVAYSYRFNNIPLTLAANMNVNQRTQDSSISVTLPDLNITLSRIYPFKRKRQVGAERWYEKIALNYTGQVRNTITTKENKLFNSSLTKDWQNGMQHNIPISATFQFLKNFSITPSVNYTERWYKEKVLRDWDTQASRERLDTISGFNRVYNYTASIGLSTKLYGFFKPWKIFGDKVQMIRHVFTPTVSFSAAPDFGDPSYGFWRDYKYVNTQGEEVSVRYSPYQSAIFGTAPQGKQALANFSFQNNVEMKLKEKEEDKETDNSKSGSANTNKNKISLIDNFTAGISYNAAADSMKWSNITTNLRLKFTEKFSMNVNGTWDTYTYDLNSSGAPVRVNKLRLTRYGSLGRLSSASTSFSYTLNNDTFKKKEKTDGIGKDGKKLPGIDDEEDEMNDLDSLVMAQQQPMVGVNPTKKRQKKVTEGELDADGYTKLGIKWSLNFNYSLNYGYADFNKEKLEYNTKLTHNLSFGGNLDITKNWRFSLQSSWDFDQNKLAMMTCNLSRNLHCWTITASFVPIGPYQSYFFTIAVNSSLLKDVKWDKRSSPYDASIWQ